MAVCENVAVASYAVYKANAHLNLTSLLILSHIISHTIPYHLSRNFSTRMAVGENVAVAGYVVHKWGSFKVRAPMRLF